MPEVQLREQCWARGSDSGLGQPRPEPMPWGLGVQMSHQAHTQGLDQEAPAICPHYRPEGASNLLGWKVPEYPHVTPTGESKEGLFPWPHPCRSLPKSSQGMSPCQPRSLPKGLGRTSQCRWHLNILPSLPAISILFFLFFFFFFLTRISFVFLFRCTLGIWKFLGQGQN